MKKIINQAINWVSVLIIIAISFTIGKNIDYIKESIKPIEYTIPIEDSLKKEIIQEVIRNIVYKEEKVGNGYLIYTDSCKDEGYILRTKAGKYEQTSTNEYKNNIIGTYNDIDSMKCIEFDKAYEYMYQEYKKDSLLKELNNKTCNE